MTLLALTAIASVGCGEEEGRTYTRATVSGLGVIKGHLPPDRGKDARRRIPGGPLTRQMQIRMREEQDRLYAEAPKLPDRGPSSTRAVVRRAVANALLAEQIGFGCFKPPLAIARVADAWFAADERVRVIAEANELRFGYDLSNASSNAWSSSAGKLCMSAATGQRSPFVPGLTDCTTATRDTTSKSACG